jgi:hypothetical protein
MLFHSHPAVGRRMKAAQAWAAARREKIAGIK